MYYYPTRPRKRGRSLKKFLLFLIFLFLLGFGSWTILSSPSSFTLTGSGSGLLGPIIQQPKPIESEILAAKLLPVTKEFEEKNWRLGVYVYDFKTESDFALNADSSFEAASLTKIPVLMTLYDKIQKGEVDPTQVIQIQSQDWQNYGTSVLVYRGPNTKSRYTVSELAHFMVNRSDNTSFQVFVRLFGEKTVADNLYEWGFQVSDIVKNVTTPKEMVRMFDLMYNAKIIKGDLNSEMLDLMVKTNEEDRIPAGVPEGVRVIHKTGNAVGGSQDSGVVELEDRPYAIAILTDNVNNEKRLEELEAEISRVVYEYLKGLY